MSSESNKVTVAGKVFYVAKYHSEQYARAASRPGSGGVLVLGDVDDQWGKFWVASHRGAAALVRAGFERAPSIGLTALAR